MANECEIYYGKGLVNNLELEHDNGETTMMMLIKRD